MSRTRRSFLKGVAAAGAGAVAAGAPALAAEGGRKLPDDAVGLLYDATRCIGCKACMVACSEANGLQPDTRESELYDMPTVLNDRTKTIIKLYRDDERRSYVKAQCMHCVDPGCVGACMIGALQKREHGIVTWDADRCIGCRYCQVACPFEIPKFEWYARMPRIIKCELCDHRLKEGREPGCTEVCPRQAVVFGKTADLLAEARRRQQENPGRYVEKIYGEHDGGGTQCLYLSHVPFENLGLPDLEESSHASLNRKVQHGVYQGFIAPVALYAVLGGVMLRNRRKNTGGQDEAAGGER